MEKLIHRTPSVGSVTKKMIAINPLLTTSEIISFVRQALQTPLAGEFSNAEVIDEEYALKLARETVRNEASPGMPR